MACVNTYLNFLLIFVILPCILFQLSTEASSSVSESNLHNSSSLSLKKLRESQSQEIATGIQSFSASSEDQSTPLTISDEVSTSTSCVTCPNTVCTLSKVSHIRQVIHHNWRVDGLPDHISYLEKFQTPFEMTSEVRFNATPPNDGYWTFTLARATSAHNTHHHQISSTGSGSGPVELRVRYRYVSTNQTRYSPNLSFDVWLSIHVEDEYVTLPSQISSQPTLTVTPSRDGNQFTWSYLFLWSDIQTKLLSMMELYGLQSQLVEFKFVINSYQEGTPSSVQADCLNWSGGGDETVLNSKSSNSGQDQFGSGFIAEVKKNVTRPPFMTQMQAIMKDTQYTDLTVKSGDDEFQIHRVIAAYSSPVLATMIYNVTIQRSESVLDFGEDIGSDVVEELIRYMYTGKVEDVEEIADRLLVAASTYKFPVLIRICETLLMKQVKTENAFNMYSLGVQVGSKRLKRRAFAVMKENKGKIVAQSEEFRKLSVHHPDVMYELFLS